MGDVKKESKPAAVAAKVTVEPFVNPTLKEEKRYLSKIPFADAYHPVKVIIMAAIGSWMDASEDDDAPTVMPSAIP